MAQLKENEAILKFNGAIYRGTVVSVDQFLDRNIDAYAEFKVRSNYQTVTQRTVEEVPDLMFAEGGKLVNPKAATYDMCVATLSATQEQLNTLDNEFKSICEKVTKGELELVDAQEQLVRITTKVSNIEARAEQWMKALQEKQLKTQFRQNLRTIKL